MSAISRCQQPPDENFSDVFYQDVGRMDSDSRLSATKEKMTDLAEEAKRRQPCLLILDGLDSLIRPEHEVHSSFSVEGDLLISSAYTILESRRACRPLLPPLLSFEPAPRSTGHCDCYEQREFAPVAEC